MKNLLSHSIKFYHFFISPILHITNPGYGCRFYPTCSEYSHEAINKYGIFRGTIKSVWRILRCNPLSRGGVDII